MFKTGEIIQPTNGTLFSNGVRVSGILRAEVIKNFEPVLNKNAHPTGNYVGLVRVFKASPTQAENYVGQELVVSSKTFEKVGQETIPVLMQSTPGTSKSIFYLGSDFSIPIKDTISKSTIIKQPKYWFEDTVQSTISINPSAPSWLYTKTKSDQLKLILALS